MRAGASRPAWLRDRPAVPATMYLLIGPRPAPGFDLRELATGGRDLVGAQLLGADADGATRD